MARISIDIVDGGGRWEARDGTRVVGRLRAVTRPDRRVFLSFADCRDDAYAPLLERAATELRRSPLYAWVNERDEVTRRLTTKPRPPPGIAVVSAADADLDRLRLLDDTLRGRTPG